MGTIVKILSDQPGNQFQTEVTDRPGSTGNLLLDAINQFDRGRNAVAHAIRAAAEGEDILPALYKGGIEFNEQIGAGDAPYVRDWNPVSRGVAGFVGDVAHDPLTYTPVAAVSLPWKALKHFSKKVTGTSAAQKVADKAGLARAINVHLTPDERKAKELYDTLRDRLQGGQIAAQNLATRVNRVVENLAKKQGRPVDEVGEEITNAMETGNFSPGAQGLTEQNLARMYRNMLEREKAAGVVVKDLGENYVPHILSAPRRGEGTPPPGGVQSFQQRRADRDSTIRKINREAGFPKFLEQPAPMAQARATASSHAIVGQDHLRRAADEFGVLAENAPDHFVTMRHGGDDVKFDPAVAKLLDGNHRALTNSEPFFRMYDGAQGWWKMWSLGARPAYHFRNMVGNLWNSYLAGMTNPARIGQAAKLQRMGHTQQFKGSIAGVNAKELYEAARDRGVIGKGQYLADAANTGIWRTGQEEGLGGAWREAAKNPLQLLDPRTRNPVLQAGFQFGGMAENNARIALFIDRIKKGDSYDDAAKVVKKHLFDYSDLSEVERRVFKRVIPFYTWSRKNIPLQLEYLLKRPDTSQKINLAAQNIEQDTERPDPSGIPGWIKDAGPIMLGKEGDTMRALTLQNYLPTLDASRAIQPFTKDDARGEIYDEIVSMSSPLIKAPLEYIRNYDHFRGQDISKYKGQKTSFLGVRMPVHLAHLAKNLVMLNELDRANPGGIFGTSTYNPATGERERTRPIWGGAVRENRTDLPAPGRLVQYLFGLREFPFNPERTQRWKRNQMERDLAALKRELTSAHKAGKFDTVKDLEVLIDTLLDEMDAL